MEEHLTAVKEACAHRVGEEGLGRQIASNARDLLVNEAIERIEAATDATTICEELKKHLDDERVCESALEKFLALVDEEGRRIEEEGRCFFTSVYTEDMLAGEGGVEAVLTSMIKHEANESIQKNGSLILGIFPCHVYETRASVEVVESVMAVMVSTRCVQAIFSAMERFPDNSQLQAAVLRTVDSIHQGAKSLGFEAEHFYSYLIDADLLSLSFAALERHSNDYEVVMGALAVFQMFGNGCLMKPSVRSAWVSFLENHDNIRDVIQQAVETQQRLHPDDIYVHREAFMVFCALHFL